MWVRVPPPAPGIAAEVPSARSARDAPIAAPADHKQKPQQLVWVVSQSAGLLPRGIRFEIERTGARERLRFLGTPEAIPDNGVVSFLATVEDIAGRRAEVPLAIRVVAAPVVVAPPVVEPGGCSCATGAGPIGDAGLLFGLVGLMLWRRRRASVAREVRSEG